MDQLKTIANDMLPVYEDEQGNKLVDARTLHEQLLIGRDFTTWIKSKISNYGFVENEDYFLTLTKTGERRNVTKHDYLFLIDTGKEIAMVENNEQGRAIRKYFIEVEKQSRVQQPKSQAELIAMMAQSNVKQEKRVNALEHRMDNYDKIDTIGDLQQRLNAMIRKHAAKNGMSFPDSWRSFRKSFNAAYRTNIKMLIKNYAMKHNLKSLTAPQYLSLTGRLEDGIRVADKMLNRSEKEVI